VEARLAAPSSAASATASAGVSARFRVSAGPCWLISQFWQKRQPKLQPAVAREKEPVPGSTWKKGFFSMGSRWAAQGLA